MFHLFLEVSVNVIVFISGLSGARAESSMFLFTNIFAELIFQKQLDELLFFR